MTAIIGNLSCGKKMKVFLIIIFVTLCVRVLYYIVVVIIIWP